MPLPSNEEISVVVDLSSSALNSKKSPLDPGLLDYFELVPTEVLYEIISKTISLELPQFFADLSHVSPVSKRFYQTCQTFLNSEIFNSKNKQTFRENLMKMRQDMRQRYAELSSPHGDLSLSIFTRLNEIRDKINATKIQLKQGVRDRNHVVMSSHHSFKRDLTTLLVIAFLPMVIYTIVRNSQCGSEILTFSGWSDLKTTNARLDCLYEPLVDAAHKLWSMSDGVAFTVAALSLTLLSCLGGPFATVGFERFVHLINDAIKLMVLNYLEKRELNRLAGDDTSDLYQICRQYVEALKWEEKIYAKTNDQDALGDIAKIKNSDSYQLMHAITRLGNKHRSQLRQHLLSRGMPEQRQMDEETPLLIHRRTQ